MRILTSATTRRKAFLLEIGDLDAARRRERWRRMLKACGDDRALADLRLTAEVRAEAAAHERRVAALISEVMS